MKPHRAWATIDLDMLADNLRALRSLLPDKKILAVVKADAYGLGAIPISRRLEDGGIDYLGVGTSREALDLRNAGITSPVLVLGALVEPEIEMLIDQNVSVTIHSPGRIDELQDAASRVNRPLPVHLLVDTGMSRLGVSPEQAVHHACTISMQPHLRLEGIGTHLSSPSDAKEVVRQRKLFAQITGDLASRGIEPPLVHIDASIAALGDPDPHANMVRIGGGALRPRQFDSWYRPHAPHPHIEEPDRIPARSPTGPTDRVWWYLHDDASLPPGHATDRISRRFSIHHVEQGRGAGSRQASTRGWSSDDGLHGHRCDGYRGYGCRRRSDTSRVGWIRADFHRGDRSLVSNCSLRSDLPAGKKNSAASSVRTIERT